MTGNKKIIEEFGVAKNYDIQADIALRAGF
jgi:hypothetical protein